MTKKQSTKSTLFRAVTSIVVIGSAIYTAYQLWNSQQSDDDVREGNSLQDETKGGEISLKKKLPRNTKITLVVTQGTLQSIKEHNNRCEQCIDIQQYLRYYPGLKLILYPGISINDLRTYFEIDDSLLHRIIPTTKEESIFHVAKQLDSSINLFNFDDFEMHFDIIVQKFHIDDFLKNLTDMKNCLFTDFI